MTVAEPLEFIGENEVRRRERRRRRVDRDRGDASAVVLRRLRDEIWSDTRHEGPCSVT